MGVSSDKLCERTHSIDTLEVSHVYVWHNPGARHEFGGSSPRAPLSICV